jgi:hypothetical protein
MRHHAVRIGHASPPMRLSPGQVCGQAEPRTRETAMTRATRQVVACDHTGRDGRTDRGHGHAILPRCCRAHDDRGGHVDHASPWPALDDLGIGQVSRWEARACGRGPALTREVQADLWPAIHVPQGLRLVRQLITGHARQRPATDGVQALPQHVRVLWVAFAHHAGGHQAPCRCAGAPYPGRALARPHRLGYAQLGCLLAHDAPPGVPLALRARPVVAPGGGHGPTMPSGSIPPVTDGLLIDVDDAAGAAPGMTFCQGPQGDGVRRLLRVHPEGRRAVAG